MSPSHQVTKSSPFFFLERCVSIPTTEAGARRGEGRVFTQGNMEGCHSFDLWLNSYFDISMRTTDRSSEGLSTGSGKLSRGGNERRVGAPRSGGPSPSTVSHTLVAAARPRPPTPRPYPAPRPPAPTSA